MCDGKIMSTSRRFSVLMSIYYQEMPAYFNRAMESIWDDQILKPNEIVLVEDGPLTEELDAVIEKWKKKLGDILRPVKLKENAGLAKALNVGVKHCSHDLIARMDSDDISEPGRFLKQIKFMREHQDVHVLGGTIQEFSGKDGKLLAVRSYPPNTIGAKKYMAKASPLAHASVVFRKEIFLNGFCYSESLKTSQDIDLWYRIVKAGYKLSNLEDVLYYVRVSSEFFKRRSRKKAYTEFLIYWRGIISLYGYNWKLIFPIFRLITRLMPNVLVRLFYSKHFRVLLNTGNINKICRVDPPRL